VNHPLAIFYSFSTKHLITLLVFFSCISQNEPVEFSTNDVKRLLALDTGKIWMMTALQINGDKLPLNDCEFKNYYYFSSTLNTDTLFYAGSDTICNTLKQDTLARFHWQVMGNLRGQFSDSIKFTDESGETAFRTVKRVTAKIIDWEYEVNEALYREEFAWFTGEFK